MSRVTSYLIINVNLFEKLKRVQLSYKYWSPIPPVLGPGMTRGLTCYTVLYCPVDDCCLSTPFSESETLLKHLSIEHSITIYNSEEVSPFLDQYLKKYTLTTGPRVLGGSDDPEDAQLRVDLNIKMLNTLLKRQQLERQTVYKQPRKCLFCTEDSLDLPSLFTHMFKEHHFNIGLLDNLIYADTFLNELGDLLHLKKECIYCREVFRNGTCLRKHMKSKNHYKINPKDTRWDIYYLVNYVNRAKGPRNSDANDDALDEAEDETWDDLTEEVESETQCLFCTNIFANPEVCFEHMKTEHRFDFYSLQKHYSLDFYSSLKLVNYLRHCQSTDSDPFTGEVLNLDQNCDRFAAGEIPDKILWDKPDFYFPVHNEDPLLTALDSE